MTENKCCWLAKETKKGWKVWLCVGEKLTFQIKGLLVKDEKDVEPLLNGSIVFVHKNEEGKK